MAEEDGRKSKGPKILKILQELEILAEVELGMCI